MIYATKITLFHAQFVMSKGEQAFMQRFALCGQGLCPLQWFRALLADTPPANVLAFLTKLFNYGDKAISKAASSAFQVTFGT